MTILRYIFKILNFIPMFLVLYPKRFFLGRKIHTLRYRGPLIIAANHKGFGDYVMLLTMFFFRKMTVVVSEQMYDYSPVLRFFLKFLGVIRADRFSKDPAYMSECIKVLNKGGIVLIFPESKIETEDEFLPFHESFATVSVTTGVPVLPIYHDGKVGVGKRCTCVIGEPIYPADIRRAGEGLLLSVHRMAEAVFNTIKEGKALYKESVGTKKRREKKGFCYRFVSVTGKALLWAAFRPVMHFESARAKYMPRCNDAFIIITNHTWWLDAPFTYCLFSTRLVQALSAKDIQLQNTMEKVMKCVFVDRNKLDFSGMRECLSVLSDGAVLHICAEGRINTTDELLPFHDGAAFLALLSGVPVVPLYLDATYKAFHRAHVYMGDPIALEPSETSPYSEENLKKATAVLFEKMRDLETAAKYERLEKDTLIRKKMNEKHRAKLDCTSVASTSDESVRAEQ